MSRGEITSGNGVEVACRGFEEAGDRTALIKRVIRGDICCDVFPDFLY